MFLRLMFRFGMLVAYPLIVAAVGVVAIGRALPHGAQIVYVSGFPDSRTDLYLMEVDRGLALNLTGKLTPEAASYWWPAWSPDGKWLAFTSNYQGGLKIFLLDAETYTIHPLLTAATMKSPYWQPDWSPDGSQVAFKTYAGWVDKAELFTKPMDANQTVHVTEQGVANFAWAPDNRHIAFVSTTLAPMDVGRKIVIADRLGEEHERYLDAHVDLGSLLSWSPDGRHLAYESTHDGDTDVYTIDVASGELVNLSHSAGVDGGPVWSPDGRHLAFYSERSSGLEIYVANADGSDLRRLTDSVSNGWGPQWSPDGTRLAYVGNSGGRSDIYVVGVNGGSPRALTTYNILDDWMPLWRP